MSIEKHNKRIALFCLTPGGVALARRLNTALPMVCFTSEKLLESGFVPFNNGFADTVRHAFGQFDALIVIGATGVTVRVIAPVLQDKLTDPAVLVIDEKGQFVISLLSGHMGGANALATKIAGLIGGQAVITTATDVNQIASLDVLAQQMNATMVDFRQSVKTVNQLLVSGKRVGLWWHNDLAYEKPHYDTTGFIDVASLSCLPALDALVCVSYYNDIAPLAIPIIKLVPKRIVAGLGCRKNVTPELVEKLFSEHLAQTSIDPLALSAIGSITLKAQEPALVALAKHFDVPFHVFTAQELSPIASQFPSSEFVQKTVGVGCVSQPVAWLMSQGLLIGGTRKEQGVTMTLGVVY